MRNPSLLYLLCAATLMVSQSSGGTLFSSQDRHTTGPALWKTGWGVRTLSLGGAGVALADDAAAAGWNPAAINALPQGDVLLQRDSGFDGQSRHFLSYVRPVWRGGGRRTWGLTLASLQEPSFDLVDDGASYATVHPLDLAAGVTYAHPWGTGHWGATAKAFYRKTYEHHARAAALDLGYYRGWPGRGAVGVALANIGVSSPAEEPSLPLALRFGGTRTLWSRWRNHGAVVGELDLGQGAPFTAQGGMEYVRRLSEATAAALRWGYRTGVGDRTLDGVTVGLGVERGALRVNYGLVFTEALGALHRFEVGWRLGRPLPQEARQNELWRGVQDDADHNRWTAAMEKLDALRAEAPGFAPAASMRRRVESRLRDILDPETLYQIGLSYLQRKDYEKAEDYFQKLILARPDHVEGAAALKKVREALGPRSSATSPSDDKRRRLERTVRRALEAKRWEEAVTAARGMEWVAGDALGDDVHEARRALYAEAVRREERGDLDEAIRLFRVLQGAGGQDDSTHRLAVLETARQNLNAARSAALYQEGVKAYAAGDAARARELFQQALRLTPDDLALRRALERLDVDHRR